MLLSQLISQLQDLQLFQMEAGFDETVVMLQTQQNYPLRSHIRKTWNPLDNEDAYRNVPFIANCPGCQCRVEPGDGETVRAYWVDEYGWVECTRCHLDKHVINDKPIVYLVESGTPVGIRSPYGDKEAWDA